MHGGRGCEDRKWHMLPAPTAPGTPSTQLAPVPPVVPSEADSLLAPDCFLKDGRKIRVGDCALFQAGNAPPFIGIIRRFATSKEDYLKLCVNWLYRPADVKLAKGILVEASPNEVFYSFHKDVISAASLLHPCKVAFLRKGVELPSGICSFVCRRVYDIENKCLWWLTDQDYINERQEEVDQLLDKTRLEMHGAVQSGGRSPKPLNGPASAQQLKSGSDSVQNSGTSFPSQVKGKKRERGDQGTEPTKRERSTKTEDGDSVSFRLDGMIKAEIAKISGKGGITNAEGVEKLVHLMQLDRSERQIDLAGRVLLADVIAATDRDDFLHRFVQLRGVPVLDDWLQEVHKGKNGDGSSPKESDKVVEELLLALLHALDKLPVNLNALRTCNIGKSVNYLRSHKNLEIQKKARSLVDTWKKRVDLEIKNNEAKSFGSSQAVPWPGKPVISEVPHALNRRAGSTDVTMKNSAVQPSTCRTLPVKPVPADAIVKSTPITPGSLKLPSSLPVSASVSSKDSLSKAAGSSGILELPQTAVKEEKSSSSSQSQNNSQSCSSDHAKAMSSSGKDDARSSTAVSMNNSKISSGSTRHRRSSNGFLGTSVSGVQKETNLGKSGSLARTTTLDKVSQVGMPGEKTHDLPVADHGNSHRLIVRLPNPGRSPVQTAKEGSFEDPSIIGSRTSSPGAPEKHENSDRKVKARGDRTHTITDVNTESWQSNDIKGLAGSDEGDISPTAILDEEGRRADESEKATDVSRASFSSSVNEKGGFLTDTKPRNSFSSMNALIESCVNAGETSVPLSAGDDLGMNLLASVAAGEMSKSGVVSPSGSPGSSLAMEEPCTVNNEAKSRLSCDDGAAQCQGQSDENADFNSEKHGKGVGSMLARDELQEAGTDLSGDNKIIAPLQENELTGEQSGQHPVSSINSHEAADSCLKPEGNLEEERTDRSFSVDIPPDVKNALECDVAFQHLTKQNTDGQVTDSPSDFKLKVMISSMDENEPVDSSREKVVEGSTYSSDCICNSLGDGCHKKSEKSVVTETPTRPPCNDEMPSGAISTGQQLALVAENHADNIDRRADEAGVFPGADNVICSESADSKPRNLDSLRFSQLEQVDSERKEPTNRAPSSIDERADSVVATLSSTGGVEEIVEWKEALEKRPTGSAIRESSPTLPTQEADVCTKPTGSKLSGTDTKLSGIAADGRDELASSAEISSLVVAAEPDSATKLDFDLNEGIIADDGNQTEPAISAAPVCSSAIRLPCIPSFGSSPMSNGSPATITVAAPAKGPFVPPEDLLKSKAEPGWKGSAATSAFRPAEPRKILEMPLASSDIPSFDTASGKHGRVALDIDLNVPDERVLEDMASQSSAQTSGSESGVISNRDTPIRSTGGLDLDLNRVDEGAENGQFLAIAGRRFEAPILPGRPSSGGFLSSEAGMLRDFDLNNGPGLDEVGVESMPRSQHAKSNSSMSFLPTVAGLSMNNTEFGSVSSWFPSGNSYPAVAIPSFLPDRGDQPYPIVAATGAQRILGSVSGAGTFGGNIYRGPVLSSSPAMGFSPATAFPYAHFPFGSNYSVASTSFSGMSTTYVDSSSGGGSCFPAIHPQLVGQAGAASSQYPRPYLLSFPEGIISGGSESSRKWAGQALDLNAGPGSGDVEVKDDRLSLASRQLSVASSQAFTEEQARIYQVAGGGLKRKEPEGGWDAEKFVGYKQQSWQ